MKKHPNYQNPRRVLVTFPYSDYYHGGRIRTHAPVEWRVYFIRDGDLIVRYDNVEWKLSENLLTMTDREYSQITAELI